MMDIQTLISLHKSGKLAVRPAPPEGSRSTGTPGYRRIESLSQAELMEICADDNPDRFNDLVRQIQEGL